MGQIFLERIVHLSGYAKLNHSEYYLQGNCIIYTLKLLPKRIIIVKHLAFMLYICI